jgi:hypothetical protein
MSVAALNLYEQLAQAPDERTRAKIIAEAFIHLEERYPAIKEVATESQVRETELRLQKEIREVELRLQKEIRQVELSLQKEIEGVRLEIKEVELRLQRDIKGVEVKIAETRSDLVRWVVSVSILQGTLIIGVLLKVAHLI